MPTFETRFRQILVQCPGRPSYSKPEKMEIKLIKTSLYGWFPSPCNGCDSMNGTMPCDLCRAFINQLFMNSPEIDVSRPIIPDFGCLRKATPQELARIQELLSGSIPPKSLD